MSICDRCLRQTRDEGAYLNIEVEFLRGGTGAHDERKLRASLCDACFEAVERQITKAFLVRSVFGMTGEFAAGPVRNQSGPTTETVGTLQPAAPVDDRR